MAPPPESHTEACDLQACPQGQALACGCWETLLVLPYLSGRQPGTAGPRCQHAHGLGVCPPVLPPVRPQPVLASRMSHPHPLVLVVPFV